MSAVYFSLAVDRATMTCRAIYFSSAFDRVTMACRLLYFTIAVEFSMMTELLVECILSMSPGQSHRMPSIKYANPFSGCPVCVGGFFKLLTEYGYGRACAKTSPH